jgi:UDP-GlcNAc3NAcA epimerase
MKIATIVGARPQFIKAAAVSRAMRGRPGVDEAIVHTGQHYDENMSEVFFRQLDIPLPSYDLGVGSGPHGQQTGQMLAGIESVLLELQPDWVLVYGDTNSTLAGALAAAKLGVPVAHVEAGLRSFNRRMAEEINRITADHVSDLLFAPTETAVENLRNEGIWGEPVHLVGDVMYDAALFYLHQHTSGNTILEDLGLAPGKYILATVHRAETVDDPQQLAAVFSGLGELAGTIDVVLPLHPRTRKAARQSAVLENCPPRLRIIEPVGYLDMLALENAACLIVTDSGGVQKEAFFARIPCLTLRSETEWTELVELGWNRLVPPTQFGAEARTAAEWIDSYPCRKPPSDLYGGGNASSRICDILCSS